MRAPAASPPPPRRVSLQALLASQFGLAALVALLVMATLMSFWRVPAAQAENARVHRFVADMVARQLDRLLDAPRLVIDMFAEQLQVQDSRSRAELNARLDALVGQGGLFESVQLTDLGGRVVAAGLPEAERGARATVIGNDLSRNPALMAARQAGQGIWSDSYLSPTGQGFVVALARPLGDGFLVAEVPVPQLSEIAGGARSQYEHAVFVFDRRGQVIADPAGRLSAQQTNLSQLPLLRAALAGDYQADFFPIAGDEYFGATAPVSHAGWTVLAGRPADAVRSPVQMALIISVVTFVSSVGVGLVVAFAISRWVIRRIAESVAFAGNVAAGRYDRQIEPTRIFELEQLRQSLVRMAAAIQSREKSLRVSEERLRTMVETTPSMAIQWFDAAGTVLYWNSASEQLFGYAAEEAVGRTLGELIYTPKQDRWFIDLLAEIAETGQAAGPFEGAISDRHGRTVWLLSTTFALPTEQGEPIFVCMDIDITAKRQAEEELRRLNAELEHRVEQRTAELTRANADLQEALASLQRAQSELVQAEKLAALGALVAGVAHELNTPIGNSRMAVSTCEQQLRQFQQDSAGGLRRSSLERFVDAVEQATAIALRNLERAAELVSSFKRVAVDQTSSQRRRFELRQVLQEILLTLQPSFRRTGFEVSLEVAEELNMDSYPGPLGQALTNLIQNALLHGLDGRQEGRVRVAARRDPETPEQVLIEVSDDGVGMSPAVVARIFDPFFTTRLGQGGSGLGLHIVHNIVTGVLGGQIAVDSREGQGTRFLLTLPADAPLGEAPQDAAEPQGGPRNPPTASG